MFFSILGKSKILINNAHRDVPHEEDESSVPRVFPSPPCLDGRGVQRADRVARAAT